MIRAFIAIGFRELFRRKAELLLTFAVPIAFFSIFALIFGGQGSSTPDIEIAVVDLDDSETSRKVIELMKAEGALDVQMGPLDEAGDRLDLEAARALVRDGDVSLAVVLLPGFGERVPSFFGGPDEDAVLMLRDPADPIAGNVVGGLLQKIVMSGLPERMAERGLERMDDLVGALTPEQEKRKDEVMGFIRQGFDREPAEGEEGAARSPDAGSPVRARIEDVTGDGKPSGMISYYAAAIAVMFLLFSASGAGGTLLEEEQNGTLERLLTTRVTMTTLLLGKGAFLVTMGVIQITIMFLWGALVFGLDLFSHLAGFAVMTSLTALAASAFGLLLATMCRSRAQLAGVSTIVILSMSALGGSMFPRFLMSEAMQAAGLATFNAWALEGYLKVFWRGAPLVDLWPQALVLLGITTAFFLLARQFARRWETV
ncbi:MAG: ABC transporter permease [Planctomycetota bacterium]